MDIQEYIDNNIIGANNVEVDCTKWEYMKIVSDSCWNSFLQGLSEAVLANANMLDYNTASERQGLELLLYRFSNAARNYQITRNIFYNSLSCSPLNTADLVGVPQAFCQFRVGGDYPAVQTAQVVFSNTTASIDYTGKTTFIEQYYTDFQFAITEMSETQKDFFKFFYKATEASLTTPATPFNGTC
jgi:hypothetical protein